MLKPLGAFGFVVLTSPELTVAISLLARRLESGRILCPT